MGIEKEGSKSGGGYVGGFFQLFDWKAKSRKKLFSSKSDFPERSKQGKKSDGNLPMTRFHLTDEDEIGAGSSFKGSSDYSCASSVTDDDGYGARAPGVVARLMGLDSLPTSSEPYSTPFFDTQSLRDAHCRKNPDNHLDHQIIYSGNLLHKVESHGRDFAESKPQRMISRPIEKFQTEILPPKSAKSIPITHHKLLSPIKSHGFIPSENAAHIMEAAAKIIEPGPPANTRTKMPVVGSSSVPLKVRDLKEKMEAVQKMPLVGSSSVPSKVRDLKEKVEATHKTTRLAEASRRPVESNAAKCLKGQSLNKSWNGSVDTTSFRASDIQEGTSGVKNKGKSISLAIQAKVNVQRREGLHSSSSRSLVAQKEQSEVKSSQPFKVQTNTQKNLHKRTSMHNNPSGVLRQNNQKQNCVIDRDRLPSKPLASNLQGRKLPPVDLSTPQQKTLSRTAGNSKTGSRKLDSDATDSGKGISYSSTKNVPRKKRSIDRDFRFEKNQVVDMFIDKSQKEIKSNQVIDRHFTSTEDSKRKGIDVGHSSSGMDVVSFTFTAPLTRSMPGSETPGQLGQRSDSVCSDNRGKRLLLDTDNVNLASLGYNVIGADALSMLLEQKLRELSYRAGPSQNDYFKVGSSSSSSSIFANLVPTINSIGTASKLQDKGYQNLLLSDKLGSQCESDFSSTDPPAFGRKQFQKQGVDEMDEDSSNHLDAKQLLDCQLPSPVSILEPSFSTESCNSSDTADSSSTEGKQCSSAQAQDVFGLSSLKKFHPLEADTEFSDSASSTSTGTVGKMIANTTVVTDPLISSKWELEYVKQILCNVELMFKDFALGRARDIINPYLFDLLESRKVVLQSDGDETRLRRKLLFDCVSECMDLRCRRYVGGGCRTWIKGVAMVRRKEWLAEELHKEICGWRAMGDCMVDELVDKDMSSQYGRWMDFEVDAFVLGVEVEGQIFNSLVDEVVADILQF